jgi:copper resistance protein C
MMHIPRRHSRPAHRWRGMILGFLLAIAGAVPGLAENRLAENRLDHAMPGADASVTAPSELRLCFADAVDLKTATISIVSSTGAEIAVAGLSTDSKDGKVLVATLTKPLDPGKYLVEWRLGGADSQPTQGRYAFTVAGIVSPG